MTGKVEYWHRSIQGELLDPHGPFDSLEAAQTAVDAWRVECNTVRPHQALNWPPPPISLTGPTRAARRARAVAAARAGPHRSPDPTSPKALTRSMTNPRNP
jgi:transposase InsO family protein